jgi:hypothetical protein
MKAPAPPCNVDWIAETRELRITEIASGHMGNWEFHVDLERRLDADAAFRGIVAASYRTLIDRPPAATTQRLELAQKDVSAALVALRDGLALPDPEPRKKDFVLTDTGLSMSVFIDASDREHDHYVQFFTDTGQSQPQGWAIRGCDRAPSFEARKAATAAYAQLQKLSGRDLFLDALGRRH